MAEEAFATAKVREVALVFNDKSTKRQRTVHAITAGLARSTFVKVILLQYVPVEMMESVRQTLSTNSGVRHVGLYCGSI